MTGSELGPHGEATPSDGVSPSHGAAPPGVAKPSDEATPSDDATQSGKSPACDGATRVEPFLQAVNVSKGDSVIARRVEWAGTSAQRRKGLLGRTSIDAQEGIYIVPCKWIHMFGMKFPIDVAFLARDGRVLTVQHSLKPNRLSKISLRAEGVLELAAGRLSATGTSVGDIIQFREADS